MRPVLPCILVAVTILVAADNVKIMGSRCRRCEMTALNDSGNVITAPLQTAWERNAANGAKERGYIRVIVTKDEAGKVSVSTEKLKGQTAAFENSAKQVFRKLELGRFDTLAFTIAFTDSIWYDTY